MREEMHKATIFLVLVISLLPLLAACDTSKPGIIPGPTSSIPPSASSPRSLPLASNVSQLWKVKPGNFMRSTPTVVDGVLYAAMEDTCICALDAATGKIIWRVPPPGLSLSTPAVWNGLIFVGLAGDLRLEPNVSQTAYLYALDAATGDGRWRYKIDDSKDEYSGPPVVVDGVVYFGSGWSDATASGGTSGHVTALDASSGKLIWQRETSGSQDHQMAIADQMVFYGDGYDYQRDTDMIYAVDSKTGREIWTKKLDYDVDKLSVLGDKRLYVFNDRGLVALDEKTGNQLWESTRDGYSFSTPASDGSTLYIAQNQERAFCIDNCPPPPPYKDSLLALDAQTGQQRWQVAIDKDGPHTVMLHDGVLYYTTFRPDKLKARDISTGQLKWEFEPEDSFWDSITFDGGMAYFGVSNGTLYALQRPGYPPPTARPATPIANATPVSTGNSSTTSVTQEGPMRGMRAPDFDLLDLHTNNHVKLSELRGKPVFLNFWATWCPPCKEEMPAIQKLYEKYKGQIEFIGISSPPDDTVEKAKAFVDDNGFDWTFVDDADSDVSAAYQEVSIPTSFFIDKDGIIKSIHIGQMDGEQIEKALESIR